MKNKLLSCLFVVGLTLSISSCSTPEERATIVKGNDSSHNKTMNTDSAGSKNMSDTSMHKGDSSKMSIKGDSSKPQQKVSTFNHTPIDTITSKSGKKNY